MISPHKLVKYHLYLLQLENYELARYWQLLVKRGWFPPKEPRKNLVWTAKALALFMAAIILHLIATFWIFYFLSNGLSVLSIRYFVLCGLFFLILNTLYPILYTAGLALLWPIDFLVKSVLILKAKSKIKNLSNLKIIGIAGSYGKTTMKEVLKQVLGIRYKVLSTPESVNVPVGIARWILKNLAASENPHPSSPTFEKSGAGHPLPEGEGSIEVVIVEMGEHYRGDVEELCGIAKPDIAVVTGINEAHLERMKNLDGIVATVFEVVSHAKAGATVVLNGDDELAVENYQKFVWPDSKIQEYKVESIKYKVFDSEKLLWKVKHDEIGEFEISLLGEYALGNVDAAIKIGKLLGMTLEEIKKGLEGIKPVEHRLQPIKSSANVLIIDDSYNGNPDGAAEAIKVLSRFENRRKIYITPGLVEMGQASADIHCEIGKQLAGVADVVILIRNSVTPFIEEGIRQSVIARSASDEAISNTGLPRPSDAFGARNDRTKIIWFETVQEAHAGLKNILQPWDVVLFQNDWGDNYV